MYEDITSLDELFSVAKKHMAAERIAADAKAKAPRRTALPAGKIAPDETFLKNWVKGGGVAIIHEETETLLGNFTEYTHPTGARKLVREDAPISVETVEKVSGDWWIAAKEEVVPREEWHQRKQAVIHLILPTLLVHSPATPVSVLLSYGGMARVELEADTVFAQVEGEQETLLTLPAGTNVLPLMSRDCKINLKMELAL